MKERKTKTSILQKLTSREDEISQKTSKGHPVIKCLSDINREGTEKFNEIMSLISAYIQIYLNSLVYETLFRRDSRIGSKKE